MRKVKPREPRQACETTACETPARSANSACVVCDAFKYAFSCVMAPIIVAENIFVNNQNNVDTFIFMSNIPWNENKQGNSEMQNLTDNETEMLLSFARCELSVVNGSPEYAKIAGDLNTFVFLEDRAPHNMTISQKKGVLSSLVQKGLVIVCPDPTDDDGLDFTAAGFEAVKALLAK